MNWTHRSDPPGLRLEKAMSMVPSASQVSRASWSPSWMWTVMPGYWASKSRRISGSQYREMLWKTPMDTVPVTSPRMSEATCSTCWSFRSRSRK